MCQTKRLKGDISQSKLAHHTQAERPNGTNVLNEELIGFSELVCSPSESFKFLGSVKSSQREDEDGYQEKPRKKQREDDSF